MNLKLNEMNVARKVRCSKFDRLWLSELYKTIKAKQRPSYRVIRAKLHNRLPKEYNPEQMDERLSKYWGEEIAIYGVALVDPTFNVFGKANEVIQTIRKIILKQPELAVVEVSEIAKWSTLQPMEIALVLRLIANYGKFFRTATGSQEFPFGYGSINVELDKDVFNQYLYFTNIESLMEAHKIRMEEERPSITQGTEIDESLEKGRRLNPIFKSRIDRIDPTLCFVLMPFTEVWSAEIYQLIKTTIEGLNLQCIRADNLNGPIIIEDIWTKINQAAFIVADVTNKNPNVMYEVGIAHTVGTPTILLTQNKREDIPFDFGHLRHIMYRNTVAGATELRDGLASAIKSLLNVQQSITLKKNKKPDLGVVGNLLLKGY